MYRFIAILLISALLLTGCAKAETDSYIQVIVPEGGGYEAAVTPKPAAPSSAPSTPFSTLYQAALSHAGCIACPDGKADRIACPDGKTCGIALPGVHGYFKGI